MGSVKVLQADTGDVSHAGVTHRQRLVGRQVSAQEMCTMHLTLKEMNSSKVHAAHLLKGEAKNIACN